MVFILKDPKSPFKKTQANGKKVNPVRWSFIKEDHFTDLKIINNMVKRFQNHPMFKESRYIYFFDRNKTNPIHTIQV